MNVIIRPPNLTEAERKIKMSYITEEMLKIAKKVEAKKKQSAGKR